MKRPFKIVPIVVLANLAFAAELPKEGSYDYTTCFTRNVTHLYYSPTRSIWSYHDRGKTVSDPAGGMFDSEDVQCVGMAALLDGRRYGNSACIAKAKDGADRLTRLWYDNEGKLQREVVAGTGIYDGMVMTGTTQIVKDAVPQPGGGPTQTLEYCSRNVGTYKVK